MWIQLLVTVFKYYRLFDNCTVFSKNILDFPQTHMSNTLPGDCQHHWSSFIREVVRAFMGFKRIIKVHIYCELFNFCMCLHNCYCAVLYNSARDLPVSNCFSRRLWAWCLIFLIESYVGVLTVWFFSYTPLSGFYGVLSGLLVGIKQLLPDQELNLFALKIKAKVCFFNPQVK